MSAALMCWACSMRQRRSFVSGCALKAASKMFERLAVGAVADGVDVELEAVLDGQPRGFRDVLDRCRCSGRCSSAGRRTARAARRRARPERAVDEPLDRADGQVLVAVVDDPAARQVLRQALVARPAASRTCARRACPRRSSSCSDRSSRAPTPASCTLVMPLRRHSSAASSMIRRARASRSSGVGCGRPAVPFDSRPDAVLAEHADRVPLLVLQDLAARAGSASSS